MTRKLRKIQARKRVALNGALAIALAAFLVSIVASARAADLLIAARGGDTVGLQRTLSEADDLVPDDLARPLIVASRGGHAESVAMLLGAGADPDTTFSFLAAPCTWLRAPIMSRSYGFFSSTGQIPT